MIIKSPLLSAICVSVLQVFHMSVPDHPVLSKSSCPDCIAYLSFLLWSEVESGDMYLSPLAEKKET